MGESHQRDCRRALYGYRELRISDYAIIYSHHHPLFSTSRTTSSPLPITYISLPFFVFSFSIPVLTFLLPSPTSLFSLRWKASFSALVFFFYLIDTATFTAIATAISGERAERPAAYFRRTIRHTMLGSVALFGTAAAAAATPLLLK